MLALIRSLLAPLLSLVLLSAGSGLFSTFVSVRLEIEGYDHGVIGAVTSSLYVGLLAGSIWLGRWIARWGHIHSHIIFATSLTLLVLAQAAWVNPYYWAILR